jgi:hypothetical protein
MNILVSQFASRISVRETYFKINEKAIFIYIYVCVCNYVCMYVMVKCVVLM